MTIENISWSISTKECCRPRRGLNPRPPGLQSDGAFNWATEAGEPVCVPDHIRWCAHCVSNLDPVALNSYSHVISCKRIRVLLKYWSRLASGSGFCSTIWNSFTHSRRWTLLSQPLRKHAYSNILKNLPPEKKSYNLHISAQKDRLWVLVRTDYPQSLFLSRNKKNNVYMYHCKLHFYHIKAGFKGDQNHIGMFSWCIWISLFLIPGPEVIKIFSCSTQLSMKFVNHANKFQITNNCKLFLVTHICAWKYLCR